MKKILSQMDYFSPWELNISLGSMKRSLLSRWQKLFINRVCFLHLSALSLLKPYRQKKVEHLCNFSRYLILLQQKNLKMVAGEKWLNVGADPR